MLADLDLLLTYVFCFADDLLPEKANNAKRILTDAEVVTLAVAQAIMGIPSDPRFVRVAIKRLGHLFPDLTKRSGYFKRRDGLADTIEWLIPMFPDLTKRSGYFKRRDGLADTIEWLIPMFASQTPGWDDDLLLVDSTPVECARSRETVKRAGASSLDDALANAADYGYCASHSRWFYGLRLHTLSALDGTPRAMILTSPKDNERDVALRMLERVNRHGPLTVIGDKGYAGREFTAAAAALDVGILRPRRKDERGKGPRPAPIRQRVESMFWTFKDLLTLERHGARTLHGLRARIATRILTLAAAIALNHHLARPGRQLADLTA